MIVVTKGVKKSYRMGKFDVEALRGVHFEVAPGELMAIAGASGSGKTTLLNLIGCLDRPSDGCIFIDGIEASALSDTKLSQLRAYKIGFIFQTFNLIPTLTAIENVEYPMLILGETAANRREKAKRALERVGLADQINRRPDALSGGQRQRVAIARAMVKQPKLVLADEPTASLDRKTAEDVLALMRELNEEKKTTFIISSHDQLVLNKVRRVFHLEDGLPITEMRRVA